MFIKKMNKTPFYLNYIFFLFGAYFLLATIGKLYAPKSEIFPFFHWGLYVTIPQKIETDHLMVYRHQNLAKSIPFEEFTKEKISLKQSNFILKEMKNCLNKPCFKTSLKQINSFLPENSCSVFFTKSRAHGVDTLFFLDNGKYLNKSCLQ